MSDTKPLDSMTLPELVLHMESEIQPIQRFVLRDGHVGWSFRDCCGNLTYTSTFNPLSCDIEESAPATWWAEQDRWEILRLSFQ